MRETDRSWAEIDLKALAQNFRNIRACINPSTLLLAVVKANAYGHGAFQVAKIALNNGANYLATATLDEALALKRQRIDSPILVLGYVHPDGFSEAIQESITLTIFDEESARLLAIKSHEIGKKAKIHIKIDTGMGRIGFQVTPKDIEAVSRICKHFELEIEGLFTHFASADSKNKEYTYIQFEKFQFFNHMLEERGIFIPLKHCANSATIMELPEMQLNMVRAGIISYGLYPSKEVERKNLNLIPVMRFKSRITHIKELKKGESVSYGCTYTTKKTTKIATVGVGYADGYSRLLSNRGYAMIRGEKVPVTGRICMDQCMFDVSSIKQVEVGDEVLLFGRKEDGVTAEQVADWMNTIQYEVVCLITDRVKRVYFSE